MSAACIPDKVLSAHLDQALSGAEARRVSEHLDGCEACRRRLARMQQADDMIRALPSLQPSAGFDAAFWDKVARHEAKNQLPAWLRGMFIGWRPLMASAVVAVLVAAILLYPKAESGPTVEELFMVENIEMLEDLELIQRLEILEHWEDIQAMEGQV